MTYGARVPCTCVDALKLSRQTPDWVSVKVDQCGEVDLEPVGEWTAEWADAASRLIAGWCPHEDFAIADSFDVNVWAMAAFREAVHG
jgi:hypothetical protein